MILTRRRRISLCDVDVSSALQRRHRPHQPTIHSRRRLRLLQTAAAVDVDGCGSSADVAGVVGTSVVDGTLTRTPLFMYCEYVDSSIVGIRSVGVFLVDGGHMPTKVADVLNHSLSLRTIIRSLYRRQTSRCFPSSVLHPCHVDRSSEYNETAAAVDLYRHQIA